MSVVLMQIGHLILLEKYLWVLLLYFQGSLVSWSAVKQKLIALLSTQAEYYTMTHAFKEALWL